MCERTNKWIRVYGQMDGWAKRIDYSHAHARIAVIKRSVFFASNLSREKNARKEIVLVCIHAFASFIHFNVLSLTLRHQYERECLRALFVNNCNVVVVPFSKTGSIFSFTSMVFLSFPRHDMNLPAYNSRAQHSFCVLYRQTIYKWTDRSNQLGQKAATMKCHENEFPQMVSASFFNLSRVALAWTPKKSIPFESHIPRSTVNQMIDGRA